VEVAGYGPTGLIGPTQFRRAPVGYQANKGEHPARQQKGPHLTQGLSQHPAYQPIRRIPEMHALA